MNAAARMLCGAGKYSHVTGLIRDRLHWLPACGTAHPVQSQTVSDDVQSDSRTGPCIFIRALRKFLRWRPNSVVCSRLPCSSADEDKVRRTCIRRSRSGGMEPVYLWIVSRRRWRHFSSLLTFNSNLMLVMLHALHERLCTAPLNRLPCYGTI